MVADNVCQTGRSDTKGYESKSVEARQGKAWNTAHGSWVVAGKRAFPLNCRVISFMEEDSARYRATFPDKRAGSTSTPVPFR